MLINRESFTIAIKRFLCLAYRYIYVIPRAWRIRHKERIDVVFVLSELSVWKTESLYLAMRSHPRFSPHIAVVQSLEDIAATATLVYYLTQKQYEHHIFSPKDKIKSVFKADIIIYQKPYKDVIPSKQRFYYNLSSLFVYVSYGFRCTKEFWVANQMMQLLAWQTYFENSSSSSDIAQISITHGLNHIVTGLPMEDEFLTYKANNSDSWKEQETKKKRIIWAPHHSIPSNGRLLLEYSTFLSYCD